MRISIATISRISPISRISRIALLMLAAACGPAPKPESPIVNEGSAVPETCCCKSTPIASPDGLPVYETGANRMECSSKQGTCVDEVQCQGKEQDSTSVPEQDSTVPDPPALPE
jgi:hypothetical protein